LCWLCSTDVAIPNSGNLGSEAFAGPENELARLADEAIVEHREGRASHLASGFGRIQWAQGGFAMTKSIEGVYRDGRIELVEVPADVRDETRVIVTFLSSSAIDLRERGIEEADAAELLGRFATFAVDWDSPEMDIYDDYDAAKTRL